MENEKALMALLSRLEKLNRIIREEKQSDFFELTSLVDRYCVRAGRLTDE